MVVRSVRLGLNGKGLLVERQVPAVRLIRRQPKSARLRMSLQSRYGAEVLLLVARCGSDGHSNE
jgi:hypothetical protein